MTEMLEMIDTIAERRKTSRLQLPRSLHSFAGDVAQRDIRRQRGLVLVFDHPITRSPACTEVRRSDHPILWPVLLAILLCCAQLLGQVPAGSTALEQIAGKDSAWREKLAGNSGAPVKIIEFFDYQCPFCAKTIPALDEALQRYPGKVQLILRNMPLSIHPDSMLAHQAALAAGEQGKFWEMHALLFAHQRELKPDNLLEYARQLKLDLSQFQLRLKSGYYRASIEQDMATADAMVVSGTPTFFINGQKLVGAQTAERFMAAIETALDPQKIQLAAVSEPSIPNLDLSHSPTLGNPEAPITIVEFSDLQCPFCARVAPTLVELMKQYPNDIKWVFKNFPLDFHKDAPPAHRATLAAGEQGKFWEMHDLVMANQQAIKTDDLLAKARSLNLDMARFTADLESDKVKQRLEADKREGEQANVTGTPTFFINGREYSGALPLSQFRAVIEKEMETAPVKAAIAKSMEHANRGGISMGAADAPITLLWFSDLQSSLTLKATLLVRQLTSAHPGKIRVVFKNRPLESHAAAMLLHQAALAANAQGKFWEMHDLIIATPQKTTIQDLIGYAQRLGLDVKRFQEDLTTGKYAPEIERDLQEARRRAVLGTPVFFFNSTRVDGLQSEQVLDSTIAELLSGKAPSVSLATPPSDVKPVKPR
jgi:protein-disulfide isomerase